MSSWSVTSHAHTVINNINTPPKKTKLMENKTTKLSALDSSLVNEAESLLTTLINAIPEKTHLIPLVYALANMLASLLRSHCKGVPRDELSFIIKQITDIITLPESAQQQKKEGQDTPDENQEPEPQP